MSTSSGVWKPHEDSIIWSPGCNKKKVTITRLRYTSHSRDPLWIHVSWRAGISPVLKASFNVDDKTKNAVSWFEGSRLEILER